jgi:hypothetical protein
LFAVFAMAAALPVAAQKETPPPGGPPKPFHLPKTEDFTLANGMKVTIVPFGVVPRTAVRACVEAGGANEAANQVWLSRLTGLEDTIAGGVVLSEFAPKFIGLVADALRHPAFPASQLPG